MGGVTLLFPTRSLFAHLYLLGLFFLRPSPPTFAPASPSAGSPAFSGDAFNSPPHQRSSENRGGETDVGVDEGRVEKRKKNRQENKKTRAGSDRRGEEEEKKRDEDEDGEPWRSLNYSPVPRDVLAPWARDIAPMCSGVAPRWPRGVP